MTSFLLEAYGGLRRGEALPLIYKLEQLLQARKVDQVHEAVARYVQVDPQQKKRERPLSHSRFPFLYKTIPTYGFGTMSP